MTTRSYYPVALDLQERRCVVLGGNEEAARKLPPLLQAGAAVTVIAPAVVPAIDEAARAGDIRWVPRDYREGDLAAAHLAIDASDDATTNRAARAEATQKRVLLNSVDRTALCDWIAPAVVDRGPLKIAITTGGESPYLAGALRRHLEQAVGPEWRSFTSLVGALRRRLRTSGMPLDKQTAIYRWALRSDARRLLREGRQGDAEALLDDLATAPIPGRVTLAGAGPGDPDLLTEPVREAVREADVVFHDALVDRSVLALCGPRTELVDVGKRAFGGHVAQRDINGLLIAAAEAGRDAVRLKGGDPFLFGRGGEEVAALQAAGVAVRVLPGVSAATAAPTLAGIPLTLRGVASSVAFCTAQHRDGPADLRRLAAAADTLVVLMSLGRAPELAAELAEALGEGRPVAAVSCAGTPRERLLRATLGTLGGELRHARLEAPALLVVGEVAGAGVLRRFAARPETVEIAAAEA